MTSGESRTTPTPSPKESLTRVRDEATIAADLGLPAVFTTDVPLPFEVRGAVRFDNQAQMHAVRYLHGLAGAVHGNGSHVFEQTQRTRPQRRHALRRDHQSGHAAGQRCHRRDQRAVP